MSKFRAGILALVVLGLFAYFGFTKANPFVKPFKLQAAFETASNIKPRSPVRIAGVEVGKVKKVEPLLGKGGAATVTMEIKDKALPIYKDAQLKIRPRIFLEGNFFVDIRPGSPSAPEIEDGATIPSTQTAAPVQFGDVLNALQSDTREDLRTFLAEYSLKGLSNGGAKGFNDSIKYWEPAYKNASLANDATLGKEPTKDVQRLLKGQQQTAEALIEDEEALKGLVTNFNVTAGAFAREDAALEAAIPELRDTLRVGQPALASLNSALPELRAFSRDALPGVRSSDPTLAAATPFIRQARALMSKPELRGLAKQLRKQTPHLVRLNVGTGRVLRQSRTLSACTNEVLVPFVQSEIPNVAESHPEAKNQQVRFQLQRGFPGLGGESRLQDGNNQFFHTEGQPNPPRVQPVPPTKVDQPPPRRPDVPCENQQPPDLNAPVALSAAVGATNNPIGDLLGGLPLPGGISKKDLGDPKAPRNAPNGNPRSFDRAALARAAKAFKKLDQQRAKLWSMQELEAKREAGE